FLIRRLDQRGLRVVVRRAAGLRPVAGARRVVVFRVGPATRRSRFGAVPRTPVAAAVVALRPVLVAFFATAPALRTTVFFTRVPVAAALRAVAVRVERPVPVERVEVVARPAVE